MYCLIESLGNVTVLRLKDVKLEVCTLYGSECIVHYPPHIYHFNIHLPSKRGLAACLTNFRIQGGNPSITLEKSENVTFFGEHSGKLWFDCGVLPQFQ